MPQSIKVLIVEDNPNDADILVRELHRAGFELESQVVDTEADYIARLQSGLDLVLSDYQLPQFSGPRALALLKKSGLDIPFILVSGTIGEETAVLAIREGASDYLMKNRLARLGQSVTQALAACHLRAEARRAEQQLLLQATALETADDAIVITDAEGLIQWVNPAFTTQSGYTPAEAVGQTFQMVKSGEHDPEFYRDLWATVLAGRTWRGNITNRSKQGTLYISEDTITPVRSKPGAITHFVAIMNDVTKRRAAEEALRASEKRFREMAENIQDVFWSITSHDGLQIHYVSPAYEHIWGRPVADLYARPATWIEAVVAEDRKIVLAAQATLANGEKYHVEYRITRPDGTVRWIEGRGYPVRNAAGAVDHAVGVSADITGRKELTGQLLQAQKMEAIGQLAGGIAHDFNNSLTIITGYARLLLDQGQFPEPKAEQLRQIYSAGVRAGNLTRQLLLFSRKQAIHRQAINVNQHITELVKMLGRLIGEHIRLEVKLAPGLPALDADASMMEQVLMNLAVNARDAMPQGGVLTLSTDLAEFTIPTAARHPDRRAGRFIRITVSDTGCGIPPENIARIFEPFYTTKPAGLGTGLGLATVFGIVQEHGGWIEVESKVGTGTRFMVFLPTCPDRTITVHPYGETAAGQGSETILLVEDEATVRDFIVAVLDHYGYRVLQADSGVNALEVWQRHASRIALLLTDMVLPDGVSGPELAEQVQAEKPAIKVVLMSGYTSEMVGQLYTRRPSTRFIQKPFQPNALAQIVREALDEAAADRAAATPVPG